MAIIVGIITAFLSVILYGIHNTLARLETKLETTIAGVETRLETKIAGVETRVAGIEVKLAVVETRLAGVETRLAGVETKLDALIKSVWNLRNDLGLPRESVNVPLASDKDRKRFRSDATSDAGLPDPNATPPDAGRTELGSG
jgi:hypothetical protein